ncbi:MAG: Nif3-like dinuclear metal center hexameric protein [Bacteroidales bacterium]|nr:Nif3-like dinuclear metal center hexameric protein [Bacteroidales bacterium]
MKASEVAAIIEEFAPLAKQEEWDNCGFCIGSPDTEVKGVLIGLDCTLELLREAVSAGANMVVTHHPLIFKGIKKINEDTSLGRIITYAIQNTLVVYAAHTNADKVASGVSGLMADKLCLSNREFLDEGGLGIIGNLPSPVSAQELIDTVKSKFKVRGLRCSKPLSEKIGRVALCGGSGGSLIGNALAKGAQAYICADVSYHNFFCEEGFMVMDIGHYESEFDIVDKLMSLLKEKINTFAVCTTANDNNPIYYY